MLPVLRFAADRAIYFLDLFGTWLAWGFPTRILCYFLIATDDSAATESTSRSR